MIYSIGLLALSLLTGAQAQDGCVSQAFGLTYDFCGSLTNGNAERVMNVFWTPQLQATPPAVAIVFEAADNAAISFAFGNNPLAPMDNADAMLGCHDFPETPDTLPVSNLPTSADGRNLANVLAGAGQNLLSTSDVQEAVMDGVCGVRFLRPLELPIVDGVTPNPLHSIVDGTPNLVVWALFNNRNTLGVHSGRGGAQQDFLAGVGNITDSPLQLFAPVTPAPTNPNAGGNGASNVAYSVSALVLGAVTAVAGALW